MTKYNIYYYHPLLLSFESAQTLQVIKDYYYLSKHGYNIYLYGEYDSEKDLLSIENLIKDSSIKLYAVKKDSFGKILLKLRFIYKIYKDTSKPIIITRHYRKLHEISILKKIFLKRIEIIHEMHEEALPFLIKNKIKKSFIAKLFTEVDKFVFTNLSQTKIYKKELNSLPKLYIVLPNGVEIDRFSKARKRKNYVITYLGQFNKWKNLDLIFESMKLLDDKYTLRIAGGKNKDGKKIIQNLIKKYNINPKRVNYLGYIDNDHVVSAVLDNSNALLLPLGNNLQSKYFTSPMKLFEYMSTSIPVVAVKYPSITSIVRNDEVYLAENTPFDFSEKIRQACEKDNDEMIDKMNNLVKNYSYENRSHKLNNFIRSNKS